MRASLAHPFNERRLQRRQSAGGHVRMSLRKHIHLPGEHTVTDSPTTALAVPVPDLAVRRAREAGGPMDRACYGCSCGYVFAAPVSTSVACPVCGTEQAW